MAKITRLLVITALTGACTRPTPRTTETSSAVARLDSDDLVEVPSPEALGVSPSTLATALSPAVDDEQVSGIAVALIREGRVSFQGFGHARTGGPPPDAHTVFAIGSITKVFTATLLAELVEAGQVALDAPVQPMLTEGMRLPTSHAGLTVGHLATHTSGLPRLPPDFAPPHADDPYADYDAEALTRSLAALSTTTMPAPGAHFEYSNFGVGLLGYALGRHVGTDYGDALRDRVLNRLGLMETFATISPSLEAVRAEDHDERGRVVRPWRFDVLAGAGALQSTTHDLARFLSLSMRPRGPLTRALQRTQQMLADAPSVGGRVGLGWFSLSGDRVLFHNGMTGGAASAIAFDLSHQLGVVVLFNQASSSCTPIALNLLRAMRGEAMQPIGPTPPTAPVTLTTAQRDALLGTYRVSPSFAFVLRARGDGVEIEATGQRAIACDALSPSELWVRRVGARVRVTGARAVLVQDGREVEARRE